MASIRQRMDRNGKLRYQVEVRIKGFPRKTATFDRLTDARRWAAKKETEIKDGKFFDNSEAQKNTVANMIDRYLAESKLRPKANDKNLTTHMEWWRQEVGHLTLAELRAPILTEKRDKLAQEETKKNTLRTPGTVNRYLVSLGLVLSRARRDWGWLGLNPMENVRKLKEPRGRVRFLLDEERADLLRVCKASNEAYLYPVVLLALSTGARKAEIMGLRWQDFDVKRGILRFEKTKNDERRAVPLTGPALKELKRLKKLRRIDTDLIFTRKDGKAPKEIKKHWNKAVEDSNLKDFRFHDLRHSCASYLAMNGASLAEIGDILGHKTVQMTKRYSHLTEQHTRRVLLKMTHQITAG